MISVSVQVGPGNQPGVDVRQDGPDRLELRGRLRRPWLVWAALGFGLAAVGQLEALRDRSLPGFLFATLAACAMAAALLVRRRLTLDRVTWTAVEGFGLVTRLSARARSIAGARCVVVRQRTVGDGEHTETRYPTALETGGDAIELDEPGTWEAALPVAEAVARFCRVDLRDEVADHRRPPDALDVPLRYRTLGAAAPTPPKPLQSRLLFDRPSRLRVRIPMPSVRQIVGLNVLVALFCSIPFTILVVLPLLGGSLRDAGALAWAVASSLFPVLLVGSASALAVFGNGGLLDVTPARLRLVQNGILWRREVVIPADELEDLVRLDPELGGARSLLAYFSDGVLAARSDRASVRFGYGLRRPELDWLRARVLDVLRVGRGREIDRAPAEEDVTPRPLPWLVGAGAALGALAGNLSAGPLAVCVALPFLEHVLNGGTVLGALLGARLDPDGAGRSARRAAVGLTGVALLLAAAMLLGAPQPLQVRSTFDEAALLRGRTQIDERQVALGFLPCALIADAALLHALLWFALWRSRRRATAELSPVPGPLAGDTRLRLAGLVGVLALGAALRFPAPPAPWPSAVRAWPTLTPARGQTRPQLEAVDLAPAAGEGELRGRMRWAGQLATEVTAGEPRFWFRDEDRGTEVALRAAYDPATAGYRIIGPPGRYLVEATFGFPRANPDAALIGSLTFVLAVDAASQRDLALSRVMRLVEPVDSADHAGAGDAPPVLRSPVRFAWNPVPGAAGYRYRLDPAPAEAGPGPETIEGETPLPHLTLPLAPGSWNLRLHAAGPPGTGDIGHLEVYRPGFRAWAFAFIVH